MFKFIKFIYEGICDVFYIAGGLFYILPGTSAMLAFIIRVEANIPLQEDVPHYTYLMIFASFCFIMAILDRYRAWDRGKSIGIGILFWVFVALLVRTRPLLESGSLFEVIFTKVIVVGIVASAVLWVLAVINQIIQRKLNPEPEYDSCDGWD